MKKLRKQYIKPSISISEIAVLSNQLLCGSDTNYRLSPDADRMSLGSPNCDVVVEEGDADDAV